MAAELSAKTVTVGTGVTAIFTKQAIRTTLYVYNRGASDIYVGFWDNVTIYGDYVGIRVPAGTSMSLSIDKTNHILNMPVYAIADGG